MYMRKCRFMMTLCKCYASPSNLTRQLVSWDTGLVLVQVLVLALVLAQLVRNTNACGFIRCWFAKQSVS